ncbi:leukocyte elastase inhibitor-like [Danaus plexippus]|uniref:leukocyte elastase inhibitor-like n=1 Tax=Danaus plexippus TaxID=13037 RepID=UPI002AB01D14|nr:leukocyte elastase inhibitor-like [Danaus plexippus]
MAPFTIFQLISLVAFRSGGDTWKQLQSIFGIPKENGKQFNSLFMFVNDLLVQQKPGRILKNIQVIFFDTDIGPYIRKIFVRNVLNAGVSMVKLNFDDNILAAESANNFIRLSVTSSPTNVVFDKTDFDETSMIVSGVVEFSGVWSLPFHEINTVLEDGHNGKGKVYMMHQWANVRYADIEQLGASVLELPYGEDKEYSMIIMRPEGDLSVTDVLENFAKIDFLEVIHRLYSEGLQEIEVKLPKFSITSTLILDGPLKSMGAKNGFLMNLADFSGISSEDIYISALEQRTTVMVGAGGTVIMAHTPGNFAHKTRYSSNEMGQPFLFFIVHRKYMSIVFCGRYGRKDFD